MKISNRIPAIYYTLKKKFGINWDKGIIITYGDTVYCKYSISPDLEIHEGTHIKQQNEYGVKEWWDRYLVDVEFRLSQEKEAYKNQVDFAFKNFSKKQAEFILDKCAIDLSSYIYGNIITYDQAYEFLELSPYVI